VNKYKVKIPGSHLIHVLKMPRLCSFMLFSSPFTILMLYLHADKRTP